MQVSVDVKLVFISLFPCFKIYEWVQNGTKEATFNRTACEHPNYEENIKKAEDLLQKCELHVAMPERTWVGTRQGEQDPEEHPQGKTST